MLKSFDPNETWTFESPLAPGTVFTYTAITGPMLAIGFDQISKQALARCVKKITGIELTVNEVGAEKKIVQIRKQFTLEEPFVPAEHPEVRLSEVLHYQIATGLFEAIWDKTSLTKEESGE